MKTFQWMPIDTLPAGSFFVLLRANKRGDGISYITDPYCGWKNKDGRYVRWPHDFPPTHWMPIPELTQDQP